MERPNCGLNVARVTLLAAGFLLCTQGCRSTKSEVPPGKPYQTSGTPPTVGFSTEPHPSTASGLAGLYGNKGPGDHVSDGRNPAPGSDLVYGTPPPASANLGVPTNNLYGRPGTSGSDASTGTAPSAPADSLLRTMAPVSQVLSKDPPTPGATGSAGGSYP